MRSEGWGARAGRGDARVLRGEGGERWGWSGRDADATVRVRTPDVRRDLGLDRDHDEAVVATRYLDARLLIVGGGPDDPETEEAECEQRSGEDGGEHVASEMPSWVERRTIKYSRIWGFCPPSRKIVGVIKNTPIW